MLSKAGLLRAFQEEETGRAKALRQDQWGVEGGWLGVGLES